MTILPKKKNSQAKGAVVVDTNEGVVENGQVVGVNAHNHPSHSSNSESRGGLYSGGRNSPPRWPNSREDLRGPPHTSAGGSSYNEYEGMDEDRVVVGVVGSGGGGVASSGSTLGHTAPNSSQHKRRHRASPHRNVRKHREHRSGGGSSNPATVGGLTNSPSTSVQPVSLASGSSAPNVGTSSATETRNHTRDDEEEEEDFSGYNSGDEYCRSAHDRSEEEWNEVNILVIQTVCPKTLIPSFVMMMCTLPSMVFLL